MFNVRIPRPVGLGAALILLASLAGGAAAQTAPDVPDPLNRADVLRAEAQRLYGYTDNWHKVMWLHERAAAVAPDNDHERIVDYRVAAGLAYRFGDLEKAERLLARAAEVASTLGDVQAEADLFLHAAYVALRTGDRSRADQILHRAELLTSSPLLAAEECDCLLTRIAALSQNR